MRQVIWLAVICCWLCVHSIASRADEAQFVLGLNLNGPSLMIDGHKWQGSDCPNYECRDKAFENQTVKLVPPTDPARAQMIRSSRWGGNRVKLLNLTTGLHTIYLYVWEDNNSETFDVLLDGRVVQRGYQSGSMGHWQRLGPWYVEVQKDSLLIESRGGAANFSGIEVWHGKHAGPMKVEIGAEDLAFFEKRIRTLLLNVVTNAMLPTRPQWKANC